jgi:hypothetical protein
MRSAASSGIFLSASNFPVRTHKRLSTIVHASASAGETP